MKLLFVAPNAGGVDAYEYISLHQIEQYGGDYFVGRILETASNGAS